MLTIGELPELLTMLWLF